MITGNQRRGTSIVEILFGIVIVAVIIGGLIAMQISAGKSAQISNANADGMQAVMLAQDVIGDDLGSMVFQRGDDLHIADDGYSIQMLIAKPLGDDLLHVPTERVAYSIEPIGRNGAPYRLIREDSKGRSAVPGVLLAIFHCDLVVSGPPFKRRARIEVAMTGWQQEINKPGFSATQTHAFSLAGRPHFGEHWKGKHHHDGDKDRDKDGGNREANS